MNLVFSKLPTVVSFDVERLLMEKSKISASLLVEYTFEMNN